LGRIKQRASPDLVPVGPIQAEQTTIPCRSQGPATDASLDTADPTENRPNEARQRSLFCLVPRFVPECGEAWWRVCWADHWCGLAGPQCQPGEG